MNETRAHQYYALTIVVIVVSFLLVLLGISAARWPERFTMMKKNYKNELNGQEEYFDPYVPTNFNYLDMTHAMDVGGTSLRSVTGLASDRSPFATQVSMNWYDTQ